MVVLLEYIHNFLFNSWLSCQADDFHVNDIYVYALNAKDASCMSYMHGCYASSSESEEEVEEEEPCKVSYDV